MAGRITFAGGFNYQVTRLARNEFTRFRCTAFEGQLTIRDIVFSSPTWRESVSKKAFSGYLGISAIHLFDWAQERATVDRRQDYRGHNISNISKIHT